MANAQCTVPECASRVECKGYCNKHYKKFRLYGDPLAVHPDKVMRPCKIDGCPTLCNGTGSGLCPDHQRRMRLYGDPLTVFRIRNADEKRFWSKIDKDGPTPGHRPELGRCWVWASRSVNLRGYGAFRLGKTHVQAHRYAYEILVEAIPDGLTIDHLCWNILCVNPAHLEPVTLAENLRRLWERRKEAGWLPRHRTDPYLPPEAEQEAS